MIGWNGVFVASGTDPAIVQRLASEIAAADRPAGGQRPQMLKPARAGRQHARRLAAFFKAEAAPLGQHHQGARHQLD